MRLAADPVEPLAVEHRRLGPLAQVLDAQRPQAIQSFSPVAGSSRISAAAVVEHQQPLGIAEQPGRRRAWAARGSRGSSTR